MGSIFAKLFKKLFKTTKDMKILMLGLDAAGKTTILYKLKFGEVVNTIPTIGFNMEKITYQNVNFAVWDIAGQEKIRQLWRHYYQGIQGLIFVVDSTDKDRIELAGQELMNIVSDPMLKDAIILILANKCDMGIIDLTEITKKMNLQCLHQQWFIQRTCALTGEGLYEGLSWLVDHFK